MKRLILLRHAKSDWSETAMRDFDRPLNTRGERAARLMGDWLTRNKLPCDMTVASPAVRVQDTLHHFRQSFPQCPEPHWDRRLYLATASTIIDVIQETPDGVETLLLVGHNPGLEDLILELVPDDGLSALRNSVEEKFPTAALAILLSDVESWATFGESAQLQTFVRPRDLDASLGPLEI